jgi:hypothetical protein
LVLAVKETGCLAAWWGIGEADPLVLGVVVLAIVGLAIAFLATRLSRRRAKKD